MLQTSYLCYRLHTSVTDFIPLNKSDTRGHQYNICKVHTRLNLRKYSFLHRSANYWNNRPDHVVNAPSTASFERRLDYLWAKKPAKFSTEETLTTTRARVRTTSTDGDVDNTDRMLEAI